MFRVAYPWKTCKPLGGVNTKLIGWRKKKWGSHLIEKKRKEHRISQFIYIIICLWCYQNEETFCLKTMLAIPKFQFKLFSKNGSILCECKIAGFTHENFF